MGDPAACRPLLRSASTGKNVSIVGFTGAGLLAQTSGILLFAL